jgi:hypothetical protein
MKKKASKGKPSYYYMGNPVWKGDAKDLELTALAEYRKRNGGTPFTAAKAAFEDVEKALARLNELKSKLKNI